jgi:hypothetical protein
VFDDVATHPGNLGLILENRAVRLEKVEHALRAELKSCLLDQSVCSVDHTHKSFDIEHLDGWKGIVDRQRTEPLGTRRAPFRTTPPTSASLVAQVCHHRSAILRPSMSQLDSSSPWVTDFRWAEANLTNMRLVVNSHLKPSAKVDESEACRVLMSRGIVGLFETRDPGIDYPSNRTHEDGRFDGLRAE